MIIELSTGKYLHTAYSITNIPEEMTTLDDEWSLTSQDGMDYIGTFIDGNSTESTDPSDYVWKELIDEDLEDEDEDGDLPVDDFQTQIDELQDQVTVNQDNIRSINASIENVQTNVASNSELSSATADIANATNQHFWTDTNGVHVSNEEANAEGDRNTLFNSIGMIFRKGATNLLAVLAGGASGTDPKGMAIYDGTGNNASNVVASFTDSGAVIGKNAPDESRTEISTSGLHIIQNDGVYDVPIADLGYGQGLDEYGNPVDAPFYTLGQRDPTAPIGNYSVAEGISTEASGANSHAEGHSVASGYISHAEGESMAEGHRAHAENGSVAEGEDSHSENHGWAVGHESHAEGHSKTEGFRSHAEGQNTLAQGDYSHSEGVDTQAIAQGSHAEGGDTKVEGYYSHVGGLGTESYGRSQTVIGEYNYADSPPLGDHTKRATYVLMIGNGSPGSGNESNALTVAWNGDVDTAGGVSASDDITTTGDVSGVNVSASGNVTVTGDVSSNNLTASGTITATNHVVGIVETGTTSNSWDYRLWSDGTYEAWRSHGFTGMALTSSSAGTYYGNGTTLGVPIFPNNGNTGVLQCLCSANGAFSHSSGVYLYQVLHSSATTATADMTFQFRAHASTQSGACGIDIYLRGTYT